MVVIIMIIIIRWQLRECSRAWDTSWHFFSWNRSLQSTLQCNEMQYCAIRCNTKQCKAMQCKAMQSNATQCNAKQCNATQCNAMQSNTVQWKFSGIAVKQSALQLNAVKCTVWNALWNSSQMDIAMLQIVAKQCTFVQLQYDATKSPKIKSFWLQFKLGAVLCDKSLQLSAQIPMHYSC